MKNHYSKFIYSLLITVCFATSALAQKQASLWLVSSLDNVKKENVIFNKSTPKKSTLVSLDLESLKLRLLNSPKRGLSSDNEGVRIEFPNQEGKFDAYLVKEASVMTPELQAQYPEIRAYVGKGIDNPTSIIRFSVSPQKGLSSMVLSDKKTVFIEPYSADLNQYIVFVNSEEDGPRAAFECATEYAQSQFDISDEEYIALRNADDQTLRTYRLALACTVEYSQFHGGTNGQVIAAMNTTMVRVNGVYERDLGLTMVMVPNESIIFLGPDVNSDPYTNNNGVAMLAENQTTCDASIGFGNYDIGHVFSTGGGGVAILNSPCNNSFKAQGVTGLPSPQGDAFDIDYVAHEMGHQFGGNHTYNNACLNQRNTSTAVEPGSGSTIMAYAGICSPNVQSNSDDYFHGESIKEMWLNISVGISSTCFTGSATNNATPTADAGADYTIPSRTPYRLTGSSTDADGITSHTYTWEQYDLGPVSIPSPTLLEGPLVRSFSPNSSSTRYIPRLEDYLDAFGQSTTWESMSSVSRDINFKLTVRDNDIRGGQSATDAMVVSVTNTSGPLRITSQNNNSISYEGLSTQTISWQVNGTNAGVGGAANVNILLSTDGGLTYDTTVLANTPNDGSQDLQIPNVDAANCRFMIEAVGNIFYNINFRDFAITQNLSIEDQELNNLSIYPNPNNGEFHIGFDPRSGEAISVEVYDIRGRVIYTKLYTSVSRFDEVISLKNAQSGVYLLTLSDGPLKVTKKIIVD